MGSNESLIAIRHEFAVHAYRVQQSRMFWFAVGTFTVLATFEAIAIWKLVG
jgi:hypothetical protein